MGIVGVSRKFGKQSVCISVTCTNYIIWCFISIYVYVYKYNQERYDAYQLKPRKRIESRLADSNRFGRWRIGIHWASWIAAFWIYGSGQKRAEKLLFPLIQYRGRITLSFETGDVELSRYESRWFHWTSQLRLLYPYKSDLSFLFAGFRRDSRSKCRRIRIIVRFRKIETRHQFLLRFSFLFPTKYRLRFMNEILTRLPSVS